MILKNIRLENIRSYIQQELSFPTGSILLSGDVGSGKSTILQAVDFALFGITKEVSGSSLLRNGAAKGSVELTFELDGAQVVIQRTLKRGSSVTQDTGYIVHQNTKKMLSPVELKQHIITLLQYPQEVLTKKIPIFRYTVYTPQEEMKQILIGPKEHRLDTLRKVFGIDTYRAIRENTELVIQNMKQQQKILAAKTEDLPRIRAEIADIQQQHEAQRAELAHILPEIAVVQQSLQQKKSQHTQIGEQLMALHRVAAEHQRAYSTIEHCQQEIIRSTTRLQEIEQKLRTLKIELFAVSPVSPNALIASQRELELIQKHLHECIAEKAVASTVLQQSEHLHQTIDSLEMCPVCKQQVTTAHKKMIRSAEQKKQSELQQQVEALARRERELHHQFEVRTTQLAALQQQQQTFQMYQLKQSLLTELEQEQVTIVEFSATQKTIIGETNKQLIALQKELQQREILEHIFTQLEQELRPLEQRERTLALQRAGYESMITQLQNQLTNIQQQIMVLHRFETQRERLAQLQFWLTEHIVPLTQVIEKSVMQRVYHDFNAMVERWFSLLMESDTLKMKLDEEFSPLLEQNGHDIEYTFLSGGEQTAAALAYRLALNQVINTLLSTIQTKDLIILDEPTDGFSEDQLDRMRLLFDELHAKQIILVSHESKIESMVEHVIRLDKQRNESRVV